MKISYLLLLVFAFTYARGQNFTSPMALGDKAFKNKDYYEAAFYYKKAADGLNLTKKVQIPYQGVGRTNKKASAPDRAYVCYMLAESYRLYENYMEAEGWYYNVINENYEAKYPLARLWYGVCLRANQQFDEAINQLQQFTLAYRGDNKNLLIAKKEIETCNFAKEQYLFPALLDVTKMKGDWNSDGSDYAIVNRDQNFWFTSSRLIKNDKKHLNRVYTAMSTNMLKPQLINFKDDENKNELEYGTPSFDPTGSKMYLTRWYKAGSKIVHEIYISQRQNNEWTTPKKLNSNVNIEGFNSIQPFITPDGKRMFFVSNKPGGLGGDDIWLADLDTDGNPVNAANLGKNVNTSLNEQAPCYDPASKRLVYSSKGFLGLGGFDFFESYNNGVGQWSLAHNLGYPMNSAKDDLYYSPDSGNANKFYISSDRQSDCCLELFEVMDMRHILTGLIVDCTNRMALAGAKVSFVDSLSKQSIKSITLSQSGKYIFSVNSNRPYNLVVEKQGYFTKVLPVPKSGKMNNDTLYNPEICLQPFIVNKPITLKNILYDFGKTTLRPESKLVLNSLVKIMKDNPKIKVELSSHTDAIGSDAFNQSLSQKRAQSCVDYIVSLGIHTDRIFAKGYGESKPVAPNTLANGDDNPDGRQLNRRTEFTVLKAE
jgi:OOP family OmpA-OmpF porin